jgi:hypothetical protein
VKWKWWKSDDVRCSDVKSLADFLQMVGDQLDLAHPATLYVFPRGEDDDVREKVVNEGQFKTFAARGYTFHVWERVKGSPSRETIEGLPLTIRTKWDIAEVARRLSMGTSAGGSPPSSTSPLLSPNSSSPSSPSSSNSSTEKANKDATRYRDEEKCVITGHSHQPNTHSGTELHCCHILNYAERARQFNLGFIDFMKDHHPEVLERHRAYIRPLSPEDMRRLKHHNAGSM